MDKVNSQSSLVVILTTVNTKDEAKELGRGLVEKQLVACVQMGEITSIYTWKDEIQEDSEFRLMIKLLPDFLDEAIDFLNNHHPYDTPEIISTTFESEPDYLNWCYSVSKID